MSTILFLAIFAALATAYLFFGYVISRKVTTTKDYFLADRDLGLLPVTFTLIATQLGGGMLLGTSQEAYQYGLWGILYTLSMIIGFVLLGSGIAARLQSLNIATTAQLFETVYNAPNLKKIASSLSMLTLSGLLISQMVGARALLCSIGISHTPIFIIFWFFIIIYTMTGGLKAVVWADLIQVFYIFIIFSLLFGWCLLQEPASFFSWHNLTAMQQTFADMNISYSTLLATLLLPALFSLIEQDLAQRFFAARTKNIAAAAALCASALLFMFALIPVYFGMKAQLLQLPMDKNASPLLPVIGFLTNQYVVVAAVCGILAAITSTADSLLCAISSNMSQDFNIHIPGINNKLISSKILTLSIGISCLITSFYVPSSIISIIISSYAISVVCLFIPLLFAYYHKKLPKNAALYAIIGGFFGLVVFSSYPITYIPKEFIALACSSIGFTIGYYVSSDGKLR